MNRSMSRRAQSTTLAVGGAVAIVTACFGLLQLARPGSAQAGPLVSAVQSAAHPDSAYLLTCAHQAVQRPVSFDLLCGNGVYALDQMTWSTWGGNTAAGEGRYVEEDCKPSCADGRLISYPVTVVANKEVTKDGVSSYHNVTLTFPGARPDWVTGAVESYDMVENNHNVDGAN